MLLLALTSGAYYVTFGISREGPYSKQGGYYGTRYFRLKKLGTHGDIIVEGLRLDHCFCREALSEQVKEDEPRLISV